MVSETKTTEAPALRRELKARHLTMIAIGGSIGTGLFVASGATISAAGPGGALFSYILIGLMVYFLMTSPGELAAYMPVSGSFSTYGQKYVEEGFGFALGWNYWYNWAVTIAVDLVAAQLVMMTGGSRTRRAGSGVRCSSRSSSCSTTSPFAALAKRNTGSL